jgi:hypothetical protein
MFKSFTYHNAYFIIIDNDFTDVYLTQPKDGGIYHAVIMVYERRGLPVVPNLVRCMLHMSKRGHAMDVVVRAARNDYRFSEFEEETMRELNKLLVLL